MKYVTLAFEQVKRQPLYHILSYVLYHFLRYFDLLFQHQQHPEGEVNVEGQQVFHVIQICVRKTYVGISVKPVDLFQMVLHKSFQFYNTFEMDSTFCDGSEKK